MPPITTANWAGPTTMQANYQPLLEGLRQGTQSHSYGTAIGRRVTVISAVTKRYRAVHQNCHYGSAVIFLFILSQHQIQSSNL